jgi:aldehyde dehydrogenase (NAD+)
MDFLHRLNLKDKLYSVTTGTQWFGDSGNTLESISPVDQKTIGRVRLATQADYDRAVSTCQDAFKLWREWPAPKRGEVVRQIGDALRQAKEDLGHLVSYEMGKSLQEGLGEVQEMIDICDFAVGLSRQLYGLTMHSERPAHRMYEQWHPLGVVGIISAFNFPVAVWSWNAMIAAVCGDTTLWKPSEKTPLCALACAKILEPVLKRNQVPEGVFSIVCANASIGKAMAEDRRVPLISATGSTAMGRSVAQVVAKRLGRTILELGGNNAIIVSDKVDLKLALPAIVFGAVGTAGQRCTTTRRLFVHEAIYSTLISSLQKAFQSLRVGDPFEQSNHLGPLIDTDAVKSMQEAIARAKDEGLKILCGGEVIKDCYVKPCLVEMNEQTAVVKEETFAPILYVGKYSSLEDAIAMQNSVDQGLSSAIFTNDMREAELFLSATGSDCGIANVNIGTSGAEIGGAFGGEKDTGGGRESGSDSWKAYMRRQTNTINYGKSLPLAQGIRFEL